MSHFDYVLLPNGKKRKIFGLEDIQSVQAEWGDYIENNWLTPKRQMFDPESKVKYMLEGLANIILRPNMKGLLTEYQKMKIEKYEIPISALGSLLDDELYSQRNRLDNGEEETKIKEMLDELAAKYDAAKASRVKKEPKKKIFPPTRRKKIEALRKELGVVRFDWVRVDTDNLFFYDGTYWRIPKDDGRYAFKRTKDGDDLYDMDQILCAELADGKVSFYDMNIEPVEGVVVVSEQTSLLT